MTTYKMTPELAKILTDLLDECWHRESGFKSFDGEITFEAMCSCGYHTPHDINMQRHLSSSKPRTFTTPDDAHKVMEKLVEKGLWGDFRRYCFMAYAKEYLTRNIEDDFEVWLFLNKERFCVLAGMFMKERKVKG